jgi:hypothetical protein
VLTFELFFLIDAEESRVKKEAYVAVAAEGAGDGVPSSDSDVMQGVFMRPSATSVCGLKLLVCAA